MAVYKNVSGQNIPVYAWDELTNEPKTGDAGNITAQISKDFGASAATNDANPTELDSTDHPGMYYFVMTQAETNADCVILTAVSSTAGVVIEPVIIYTFDQAEMSDTIWDEAASGHTTAGTMGYIMSTISSISTNVQATAASIWSYATRTLTSPSVSSDLSSSGSISRKRGDSWSISITGMGSIAGYDNVWFTIKDSYDDADTAALVQIDTDTGLLYINGAGGTAGNGSITVDDADDGDITVALSAVETAKLSPATNLFYDVQVYDASDTQPIITPASGTFIITADVTKATS